MSTEIKRIFDFAYYQLEKYNLDKAFVSKSNDKWVSVSSKEFIDKVNTVSRGLLKLGVKPNDKIAVISTTNRTEWNILDFAILQLGAQNVPIYPTIGENEYKYIFNHAEVNYCFLSDEVLFEKANAVKNDSPTLKEIYSFEPVENCKNWQEIFDLGADESNQKEVEKLKDQVNPDDLATIIYTSGTTGVPKGVMLSHNNIVSNVIASLPRLPIVPGQSKVMSFLPVCHIFERVVHYIYVHSGVTIYFAESIDKIGNKWDMYRH